MRLCVRAVAFWVLAASSILTLSLTQQAFGQDLLSQAQECYSQRSYSASGIQKAQQAADLYARLAADAGTERAAAIFLTRQSEALYFVALASDDHRTKLRKHDEGFKLADRAVKAFVTTDLAKLDSDLVRALNSTLTAHEALSLGEALYFRGINLGQWGSLSGTVESLSRWPELRRNMEIIKELGLEALYDHGPARVLGRGYHKVPVFLGGSIRKAKNYLITAVERTLVPARTYSRYGYNNVYLAEVLRELGERDTATSLLRAFLAAEPGELNPSFIPENEIAKRRANELLLIWEAEGNDEWLLP